MPEKKIPEESSIPLHEQKKNQAEYENEVDQLCTSADKRIKEEKFNEAIDLLKEALEIVKDHPWGIKQFQINDLLQNAFEKKKDFFDRKKKEQELERLQKKKQEEENKLKLARERLKQKELSEKEKRMQILKAKKEMEEKKSNEAYQKLEEGSQLVKKFQYAEAIAAYKVAEQLFTEIKWPGEALRVADSISTLEEEKAKYEKKLEKERIEQEKLQESLEKEQKFVQKVAETKQMREQEELKKIKEKDNTHKSNKEIEALALKKLDDGSKLVKKFKYNEAIALYKEAKQLFTNIKWSGEALRVHDSIVTLEEEKAIYEKKLEKERKEQEKLQKSLEKEQEIIKKAAEARKLKEKEELEKLKEKDNTQKTHKEIEALALKKLDEGSLLVKKFKFNEAIALYKEAKQLFTDINWSGEALRVHDSIVTLEEEKALYEKKLEKERKEQQLLRESQEKEQQYIQNVTKNREMKEQEELQKLKEKDNALKTNKEMEIQAFHKLDEANNLTNLNKFDEAIKLLRDAKDLFLKINWKSESDKVFATINKTINLRDQYNEKLRKEKEDLEKQLKDKEDLQKKIEAQKMKMQQEEQEKRQKMQDEMKMEQHKKEVSSQALEMIEKIEKEVAEYKDRVNQKDFSRECPYSRAKFTYSEAREMLLEIGWNVEADKLINSISLYTRLEEQDRQQRELEKQKQENKLKEQENFQKLIEQDRMQRETERKRQLESEEKKKKDLQYKDEQQKLAFKILEEGNKLAVQNKFEEAGEKFTEALSIFKVIEWQQGVNIVNQTITKNLIAKEQYEALKAAEKTKLEEAEKARNELEQKILAAKNETEKRIIEEQQRALEAKIRKEKEEDIQNQIIALIDKGNRYKMQNDYESAIETYRQCLQLFLEMDWEVKRLEVQDLFTSTKAEFEIYKKKSAQQQELELKRKQEEEELERRIREEEERRSKEIEERKEKQREQQLKEQKITEIKELALSELDKGNVALDRKRFEKALNSFTIALENFKQLEGWNTEITMLEKKINNVHQIIQETYKPKKEITNDEQIISKEAYSLLDEADKNIRFKRYDKALGFLENAKEKFQKIDWTKAIKMIEIRIKETQMALNEKQAHLEKLKEKKSKKSEEDAFKLLEEVDKDKRKHKFSDAIKKAQDAQAIFIQIGWKKEAEDLNKMIQDLENAKFNQENAIETAEKERLAKLQEVEEEEERLRKIAEERRKKRREARKNL